MMNRVMFKLVAVLFAVTFVSACTSIQDSLNDLMGEKNPPPRTQPLPPDNTMPSRYQSGTPNVQRGAINPNADGQTSPLGTDNADQNANNPANPNEPAANAPAAPEATPPAQPEPEPAPPLIEQTKKEPKMSINPNHKETISPDMTKMMPVRTDNLTPVTNGN
jgi:hypothetical protein